jgi:thiamine-monophosphate kinase
MARPDEIKMCAEDALLRELLREVPLPKGGALGPGDDCAAIPAARAGGMVLLKADCIAEDVHFRRGDDPALVGWKALCRPLSDIAAMGGVPGQALVTFFSPPGLEAGYWRKFYRGLGRAARKFGVAIAGGEMSRQKKGIAVSVALTGTVAKSQLVRRSGGRAGDWVFVTGRLGGSIRGKHLRFEPRLKEGRWLARHGFAAAMMDLSDGLGSDLPRLARASGCGFAIDAAAIPRNRGCSLDQAISDGEDYELLFAVRPAKADRLRCAWAKAFPKVPLSCIGKLTREKNAPAGWHGGWDHFG